MELTPVERVLDTRTTPSSSKVTKQQLGSGVLQVSIVNPEDAGTAVVHPCSEPAPVGTATFRLEPGFEGDVPITQLFTAETVCLTSSTPVHVIVDDLGAVSPVPTLEGDQYVALPAPETLIERSVASEAETGGPVLGFAGETIRIPRPPSLSGTSTAAVLSLEVLIVPGWQGYLIAYGCDRERPPNADVSYRVNRIANIVAIPLGPNEEICVFASREVSVRVSLLGELNPDGPNPAALPPSWRYVPGEVPAPSLRPINPERVLDTRIGVGRSGTSQLAADEVLELDFGSLVGAQTTAVSMNVTATRSDGNGFLTVWPCGGDRPTASNLNYVANTAVPNLVVTKLSPTGTVCISGSRDVHVIADVNGTYEADGGLHAVPVEPERILDTRKAIGTTTMTKVSGGSTLELQVTGGDVPADAGAATVNVTATAAEDNGFATVYPCDQPRPTASNLNFRAGQAIPNLVTSALSDTGSICLYVTKTTHLVADLAAWYGLERPAGLVDLEPTRVLDTREPTGVPSAGKTTPTRVIELPLAGSAGVAEEAVAVVMNVTAVRAEGRGFVTVWPCDQSQPTVSNLNFNADRTIANLTTVKLSESGTVCLTTTANTHLVADVAGYLTDQPIDGVALELD